LHHATPVSRCDMVKADDLMQFTVMNNDHTLLDLGCWDHLATSLHAILGFKLAVG
jgi:hypothetical protein